MCACVLYVCACARVCVRVQTRAILRLSSPLQPRACVSLVFVPVLTFYPLPSGYIVETEPNPNPNPNPILTIHTQTTRFAERGEKRTLRRGEEDEPAELPVPPPGSGYKTATFAGGCFWCMEKPFDVVDGAGSAPHVRPSPARDTRRFSLRNVDPLV